MDTMIFTRLCEYHLYEEKTLKWNQSNLGGLFVYCQNIIASTTPSGFWELPPFTKGLWKWEALPYHSYLAYVLKNNLGALGIPSKVYALENYLVKYLAWRSMQRQSPLSLNSKQTEPPSVTLYQCILHFVFPWLKSRKASPRDNSQANRLSQLTITDLTCLFDWGTRAIQQDQILEDQQAVQQGSDIQKELRAYREQKNRQIVIPGRHSKHSARARPRLSRKSDRVSV